MSDNQPITNGTNGACRDARGRFRRGNCGGPGNPFIRKVAQMRKIFNKCNSPERMREAFDKLFEQVRAGNLVALKIYFDRAMGSIASKYEIEVGGSEAVAGSVFEPCQVMLDVIEMEAVTLGCSVGDILREKRKIVDELIEKVEGPPT